MIECNLASTCKLTWHVFSKDSQSKIKRLLFVAVASWRNWSMNSKATFSRDAAHIIVMHLMGPLAPRFHELKQF